MSNTIEMEPMAKKKRGDSSEPPTKAVKIDRALAAKAQMIARDKDMSLADYISESLRTIVSRDWAKLVRKTDGEGNQG